MTSTLTRSQLNCHITSPNPICLYLLFAVKTIAPLRLVMVSIATVLTSQHITHDGLVAHGYTVPAGLKLSPA